MKIIKSFLKWLCKRGIHPYFTRVYIECGCYDTRCPVCGARDPEQSYFKFVGKMILPVVVCAMITAGCASQSRKYVLYDTVYCDFYGEKSWVAESKDAMVMTRRDAEKTLRIYRVEELGEYANLGPANYPVKIVEITQ